MHRYKILHQTTYDFSGWVQLQPHLLRLRPREGPDLRIESSSLDISPEATVRWHRDVEGNSVAVASFTGSTQRLSIESEVVIQHYDEAPHDFVVADYAVNFPFSYRNEDRVLLQPYMNQSINTETGQYVNWLNQLWQPGEVIQTFALLLRLNQRIYQSMLYRRREEEGVQTAGETLLWDSGSCRDLASLFMTAARDLGFATRFVSGYVYSNSEDNQAGSTHAWVEVFIPGAGWTGFDPTLGRIVGDEHIAVAVARLPETVSPVEGSFSGPPGATMTANVWVAALGE